jgi:acyl-CoA dehydrogenase
VIHDPDTLNALLDSVERFVRERLVPAEHVVQDTDEIPEDIVVEMKELGLFGLTIPEEYGGLGLTMEEEALVIMVMGQTSPAFRSLSSARR